MYRRIITFIEQEKGNHLEYINLKEKNEKTSIQDCCHFPFHSRIKDPYRKIDDVRNSGQCAAV